MKYMVILLFFQIGTNLSIAKSIYNNQGAFEYEVTHIIEKDTLYYNLTLESNNNDENNSWTWTLNFMGEIGSKKEMISKSVSFDPILDISSAFPIKENSKIDLSGYEAFQISFPPLVNIVDLDKKILEPKVVLPFVNTTINSKILSNPKEKKIKKTIISKSLNDTLDPTYESKVEKIAVDKTEIADCVYSTGGETTFKTKNSNLDVSIIKCECVELNDSREINKAKYYYNSDFGIVYFRIELKNELIVIKLKL